eukprot:TRINITY_DN55898_c0_g1_i1.p1 TRINITY_DN55898_c0_g1~~TRINITY_DN55898_c0_g1_i1.p1  ORF type:complete len:390 (-),score=120.41 TRINITY_DN55898_c0_g1_i1:45-1214(-)
MSIKQPQGQKRLTNIATVRLKACGKRFEIACFKNKVLNWREGIEKDISEVLQTETIFENVSKGIEANKKDLQKAFNTKDELEICKKILKNGELQVSDKEREVHLEGLLRDIVQIVVEKCVHTQTGRQHSAIAVENALKAKGFSVQTEHSAKKQALKALDLLCTEAPESFRRAQMRLRIACPEKLQPDIRKYLVDEAAATIEEETTAAGGCAVTFTCDPRFYRELDKLATVTYAKDEAGPVSLQIVTNAVVKDVSAEEVLGDFSGVVAGTGPSGSSRAAAARPVEGGYVTPAGAPAANAEAAGAPAGGYGAAARAAPAAAAGAGDGPPKRVMKCSACAAEFEDAAQYRTHCRSEWHNFNLKRKVKSLSPVTEEEFEEINLDMKEGFLAAD